MPTYYAEINAQGTVLRVIVADAAFVSKLPGAWIQTWMDDEGTTKNYAGIGHKHDAQRKAFIAPKPGTDYDLDEPTSTWKPNANEAARLAAAFAEFDAP